MGGCGGDRPPGEGEGGQGVEVRNIAMIGAGVMGHGIAQVFATAGYNVRLYDIRAEALTAALERIERGRYGLLRAAERGKLSDSQIETTLARITPTTDLAAACADADLVVEAVPEAPPRAILASNPSGFPIVGLAYATNRPARVIGWHWSSPVPVMRLAEIAVHPETADEVRETIIDVATRAGKNPVVINDTARHWGFVANRILMAVVREGRQIVAEGIATPEQVDELLKDCFRWPVGPFEMTGGRTRQGWE